MKKENGKTGLIVLVVILSILVVGLASYIVYDKVIKNVEEVVNNENTHNNQEKNKNEETTDKIGQVLNSSMGQFVVDKTGFVYYIPNECWKKNNAIDEYKLNFTEESKKNLGQYGTYQLEVDISPGNEEKDLVEAYKLDLSNIKSAYEVEFGNSGTMVYIIFIDNTGKVNELQFNVISPEQFSVKLYKDIRGYENIVSVVSNSSFGGQSAILIDKFGNEYNYYGAY